MDMAEESLTFSPREAPVYGGVSLKVTIPEAEGGEEEGFPSDELFLVIEGQKQYHVVTMQHQQQSTWLAPLPGHGCAEKVNLSVVRPLTSTQFEWLSLGALNIEHDSAAFLAQFLVNSVNNAHALDDLELIKSEHFDLANEILSTLDDRLSLALKHVPFPDDWHMLGSEGDRESSDDCCQETLLHFASRLGLHKTAIFLLSKPGSDEALYTVNRDGQLPCDVAVNNGFTDIAELFSGFNTSGLMTELTEDLDTKAGVIHAHSNMGTSLTIPAAAYHSNQIGEYIETLRDIDTVIKRGWSPTVRQQYQSKWPSPSQMGHHHHGPGHHHRLADQSQGEEAHTPSHDVQEVLERILHNHKVHRANISPHMTDLPVDSSDQGPSGSEDRGAQAFMFPQSHTNIPADVMEEAIQQYGILEESLQGIRGMNQELLRLRGEDVHKKLQEDQNLRQLLLARLSMSCPSLDANSRPDMLSPILEGDHHRSMLTLAEEMGQDGPETETLMNGHSQDGNTYKARSDSTHSEEDSSVRICVNDVSEVSSPGSAREAGQGSSSGYADAVRDYTDYTDLLRRRSWCPDSPQQIAHDSFDSLHGSAVDVRALATIGKSFSLSRLDYGMVEGSEEDLTTSAHRPGQEQDSTDGDALDESESAQDYNSFLRQLVFGRAGPPHTAQSCTDLSTNTDSSLPAVSKLKTRTSSVSGSQELQSSVKRGALSAVHSSMTKSVSTPSIPAAAGSAVDGGEWQDSTRDGCYRAYNFEEEDGEMSDEKKEMSWKEFLNEEQGASDVDEKWKTPGQSKEEKKRKPSVFTRFQNSYRTKKQKEREVKVRNMHHFVAISLGNTTQCHFCHKPMTKTALRCENCLITVHDHTCKDQVPACDRCVKPTGPVPPVAHGQVSSAVSKLMGGADEIDGPLQPHDVFHTNMTETVSGSLESLDTVGTGETSFLEEEPELQLGVDEPENWNITVDKKTLKKMNAKDIKRQDVIWELIQTEKHYVKRLKIMQKLFRDPLREEMRDQAERMFPHLNELVAVHTGFLLSLRALQNKNADRTVDEIGPLLVQQFSDPIAERMKSAYGVFCSKHTEAIQLYKEMVKTDRKLQSYCKKISNYSICEKRELPDFILGVTVRLSKYPILIEAIHKSTKDKKEREAVSRALQFCKAVVHYVDGQVARYEQLMEVYKSFDSRTTVYAGKKFKRQDLIASCRHLLHRGVIGWKNARGRVVDTHTLVLTDLLVFLQKNEQKYTFFNQDNKSCVVPLYKLLVREKRDERDSHGIYVINQNRAEPEMYELVCHTREERDQWMNILQEAIKNCPEEEEVKPEVVMEEERKKQEEKANKIKQIISQLQHQDDQIKERCDEKDRLMQQLRELYAPSDDLLQQADSEHDQVDSKPVNMLQAAIQEAAHLAQLLQGYHPRLASSVSAMELGGLPSNVPLPKRADTFSGFDTPRGGMGKRPRVQHHGSEDSRVSGYSSVQDFSQEERLCPAESETSLSPKSFASSSSIPAGMLGSPCDQDALSLVSSMSEGESVGEASAEPMMSLVKLTRYLHGAMKVSTKHSSIMEVLRLELVEAKEEMSRLSAETPGRRHNQLEKLRNLQENLSRERQEWEQVREKEQRWMQQEKAQLEAKRLHLDKQERELQAQKEDLRRQRETVQKQIVMLREQGLIEPSAFSDRSHMVHTVDLDAVSSTDGHNTQSEQHVPGHRRSASADFYKSVPGGHVATDRLTDSGPQGVFRRPSNSSLQSFAGPGVRSAIPTHLLSKRNEQRTGGAGVQQLPLKLSAASAGGGANKQQLPMKLSSSSSGGGAGCRGSPYRGNPGMGSLSSLVPRGPAPTMQPPAQVQGMITRNQNSRGAPSHLALVMKLAEPSKGAGQNPQLAHLASQPASASQPGRRGSGPAQGDEEKVMYL